MVEKDEANTADQKTGSESGCLPVPEGWDPLPLDPNYKSPGFRHYRYRGTTFNTAHIKRDIMEQLRRFQGRPSDVIVTGFPKSGTTWLQEIVWRVTHRDQANDTSGVPLEFRFPILEFKPRDNFLKMASLEEMSSPRFMKTHQPYHMLPKSVISSGARIVHVRRDVRDVCVSFYHFSRMLSLHQYRGSFAEFRDSFRRGVIAFGPYREHVKSYLEHSDTVLCLTYEQMHQDRGAVVRKIADFLGIQLTDEGVDDIVSNTSFEVMKANPDTNMSQWEKNAMVFDKKEGTFMRKGVVGDWRNYFTEEESEAFMKWCNEDVALQK